MVARQRRYLYLVSLILPSPDFLPHMHVKRSDAAKLCCPMSKVSAPLLAARIAILAWHAPIAHHQHVRYRTKAQHPPGTTFAALTAVGPGSVQQYVESLEERKSIPFDSRAVFEQGYGLRRRAEWLQLQIMPFLVLLLLLPHFS